MLKISNLKCEIESEEILKSLDLELESGKTYVLMGKNGSGKSTLAKTLMGHPSYKVTSGTIEMDGKDITESEPDERSKLGLFMAFQYPIEVPGVHFANFLRMAYNARIEDEKLKLPVFKFNKLLRAKAEMLGFEEKLLERNLNEGLSGGEKKKAEILQMAILEPNYVVLDETDSGLDIDALRMVFEGIKKLKELKPKMTTVIITHYQRIFDYIQPDVVIVMNNGKIVDKGDMSIVEKLTKEGYKIYQDEPRPTKS